MTCLMDKLDKDWRWMVADHARLSAELDKFKEAVAPIVHSCTTDGGGMYVVIIPANTLSTLRALCGIRR